MPLSDQDSVFILTAPPSAPTGLATLVAGTAAPYALRADTTPSPTSFTISRVSSFNQNPSDLTICTGDSLTLSCSDPNASAPIYLTNSNGIDALQLLPAASPATTQTFTVLPSVAGSAYGQPICFGTPIKLAAEGADVVAKYISYRHDPSNNQFWTDEAQGATILRLVPPDTGFCLNNSTCTFLSSEVTAIASSCVSGCTCSSDPNLGMPFSGDCDANCVNQKFSCINSACVSDPTGPWTADACTANCGPTFRYTCDAGTGTCIKSDKGEYTAEGYPQCLAACKKKVPRKIAWWLFWVLLLGMGALLGVASYFARRTPKSQRPLSTQSLTANAERALLQSISRSLPAQ